LNVPVGYSFLYLHLKLPTLRKQPPKYPGLGLQPPSKEPCRKPVIPGRCRMTSKPKQRDTSLKRCQRVLPPENRPFAPKRNFIFQAPNFRCELLGFREGKKNGNQK